jgi:hypothetical protein
MKKPTTHGGPRKGAGRPQGKKSANAKGRTAVTRSVSMQPESWAKLDRLRGTMSRGKFIESMLPDELKRRVKRNMDATPLQVVDY